MRALARDGAESAHRGGSAADRGRRRGWARLCADNAIRKLQDDIQKLREAYAQCQDQLDEARTEAKQQPTGRLRADAEPFVTGDVMWGFVEQLARELEWDPDEEYRCAPARLGLSLSDIEDVE